MNIIKPIVSCYQFQFSSVIIMEKCHLNDSKEQLVIVFSLCAFSISWTELKRDILSVIIIF